MIQTFSKDGAWCWFQDPRAVNIHGQFKKTYAQWITRDGKLQVGSIDQDSGKIEIVTLKANWDKDDHNVGSFLVLPDNRLMMFYARHNKQGLFCCTSHNPEDINSWDHEITISNMNRVTYSHPVYLRSEETFYVFWRGDSWKPTYSTSKDGIIWSSPKILIQDTGRSKKNIRPYFKVYSDGNDTIHIIFTDGHPRDEPENSVYYLKYQDHGFFKADGTKIGSDSTLPIPHQKSDRVYQGNQDDGRAWIWDLIADTNQNIRILFTKLPTNKNHRYCIAKWNSSQKNWNKEEITSGGSWFPETPFLKREPEPHYSAGVCFNSTNPDQIFITRKNQKKFELLLFEKRVNSWNSLLIHQSSEIIARPISPKGDQDDSYVLWMEGKYRHYTQFRTAINFTKIDL